MKAGPASLAAARAMLGLLRGSSTNVETGSSMGAGFTPPRKVWDVGVADRALRLAAAGLEVFPCAVTKAPVCPTGFKAATVNHDDILALWRRHPGPLIGVRTGAGSGLDVLDID